MNALLFLNSFAWIGFKINLCNSKEMASEKNDHCCFKGKLNFQDLLGKVLLKSIPFLNWEILVRKKTL